jgi:hypothetical protein
MPLPPYTSFSSMPSFAFRLFSFQELLHRFFTPADISFFHFRRRRLSIMSLSLPSLAVDAGCAFILMAAFFFCRLTDWPRFLLAADAAARHADIGCHARYAPCRLGLLAAICHVSELFSFSVCCMPALPSVLRPFFTGRRHYATPHATGRRLMIFLSPVSAST